MFLVLLPNETHQTVFKQCERDLLLHFLVHLKAEDESPAIELEPELPGCSTGAFYADGNMIDVARIEELPGLPEVHTEPPLPPLSAHLKMEHESPARQPQMAAGSTAAFNAGGNMVGGAGREILRGLLDARIEPEAPSSPPQQPVIPQPMVVQRYTGDAYSFSRNLVNSFIILSLGSYF